MHGENASDMDRQTAVMVHLSQIARFPYIHCFLETKICRYASPARTVVETHIAVKLYHEIRKSMKKALKGIRPLSGFSALETQCVPFTESFIDIV